MALDYRDRYPSQTVDGGTDYPEGKARDVGTPGDGTGTPWQEDLVNDLWGFLQGLTAEAGIEASGVPDTATASDRINALKALTTNIACQVDVSGTSLAENANATLEITRQTKDAGFVILDGADAEAATGVKVKAPRSGLYLVTFCGYVGVSDASNPGIAEIRLYATNALVLRGYRYSTDNLIAMPVSGSFLCDLEPVDTFLKVRNDGPDGLTIVSGTLTVSRMAATNATVGW